MRNIVPFEGLGKNSRIRSEGFLVGVKPVAKWVSHENGESILHMIFIVTKKDLLETARK